METVASTKPKTEDGRNIIDYYWYWKTEAIKADLDTKRHNFSILCSNLFNDFNIATVIRNANAFLAKEVIVYGSKKYDRRGTVGTHHYTNFRFIDDVAGIAALKENAVLIGMDNVDRAVPIETFDWPTDKHVIIALGQEQVGLPKEIIDLCDHILYIKQYGSVRSLNVGCASSIAMYDYCRKVTSNGTQSNGKAL